MDFAITQTTISQCILAKVSFADEKPTGAGVQDT